MFRLRFLTALTALIATAFPALAASPRLSIINPRGSQRGTEAVLTFSGSQLGDGEQILFYSPGFEVVNNLEGLRVRCRSEPGAYSSPSRLLTDCSNISMSSGSMYL